MWIGSGIALAMTFVLSFSIFNCQFFCPEGSNAVDVVLYSFGAGEVAKMEVEHIFAERHFNIAAGCHGDHTDFAGSVVQKSPLCAEVVYVVVEHAAFAIEVHAAAGNVHAAAGNGKVAGDERGLGVRHACEVAAVPRSAGEVAYERGFAGHCGGKGAHRCFGIADGLLLRGGLPLFFPAEVGARDAKGSQNAVHTVEQALQPVEVVVSRDEGGHFNAAYFFICRFHLFCFYDHNEGFAMCWYVELARR